MAAPKQAVWPIEPHTLAKHAILRRYLNAWTAILGSSRNFENIVYVDGFAGPGIYANGEEGSPVIALRAALEHRSRIKTELRFLFVVQNEERARLLESALNSIEKPDKFHIGVAVGKTFEEATRDVLDFYEQNPRRASPTFAFIDPFGWTGIPFGLVRKILSFPHCEVLVNLMYEEINRFLSHPDQQAQFDMLFGTSAWREISSITGKTERRHRVRSLYQAQLGTAAKYVRSFEMRN
jgi:three-Cys-motif partner protein